jgi:hypothetical protein
MLNHRIDPIKQIGRHDSNTPRGGAVRRSGRRWSRHGRTTPRHWQRCCVGDRCSA